jgi:deoxyribodipyrimidine photo-lyase
MMPQRELTDATQLPEIVTPLLDLAAATKTAKHRVHERCRDPEVKAGKKAVIDKHASRQGFRSSKKTAIEQSSHAKQMGFDF